MKRYLTLILIILISLTLAGCKEKREESIYDDDVNWAYIEKDEMDTDYDVFFIAPACTTGDDDNLYWKDFTNQKYYDKFVGSINMHKDMYDQNARFYSPLYHEAFIEAFLKDEDTKNEILDSAYEDVKKAFECYLDLYNDNRPILLAGFSEGSYMAVRLYEDYFNNWKMQNKLIACYAIGYCFDIEEMSKYPYVKFAKGEDDLGVVITYSSEAEYIDDSFIVHKDKKTYSINPLNWKTDSTPADKSLNKGACFLDTKGNVTSEIPNLTGAYIDETRGTLKVTDVSAEDYPAHIKSLKEGEYHSYDTQFFYNNLKDNVSLRVEKYLNN